MSAVVWVGETRELNDVSRRTSTSCMLFGEEGTMLRSAKDITSFDYSSHHQRQAYWTSPEQTRKIKARHFRPPIITK